MIVGAKSMPAAATTQVKGMVRSALWPQDLGSSSPIVKPTASRLPSGDDTNPIELRSRLKSVPIQPCYNVLPCASSRLSTVLRKLDQGQCMQDGPHFSGRLSCILEVLVSGPPRIRCVLGSNWGCLLSSSNHIAISVAVFEETFTVLATPCRRIHG